MGFMNKIKNLFTEEIEEETNPIKKEIQVSIPSPVEENKIEIEEKKEDEIIENKAIQKEEKFVFPVFFDDKDFDTLEPPKSQEETKVRRETYGGATIDVSPKKEEHTFKPTPIISPVYGILDKNYKKEDITSKRKNVSLDDYYSKPKTLTIDDIRNKAFGTLEDDLESTLVGPMGPIYEKSEEVIEEDNDMFEELEQEEVITTPTDAAIDDFINEEPIEENNEEVTNDDLEENLVAEEINSYEMDNNTVEDELNKVYEDNNETLNDIDLFNLIDSMYEDGDED